MISMKTGLKATLVLGAIVLASSGAAAAQDAVAGSEAGASVGTGTALIDSAQVAALLKRADDLMQAGQFAEARTVLVALADEQRVAALSAAETYLKLAAVEHGEGRPQRAAAALDDAASEAELYRQPALQARALLDGAAVYAAIRQHSKAQQRLARLAPLASSDDISAELRAEIQSRIQR